MKKEEIYLNLAELSEEQQEEVIAMLPEASFDTSYQIKDNWFFLHFEKFLHWFIDVKFSVRNKTEVNFQEFKEIMGATETGAENTQVEIFDIDFGGNCMARMEIQNGKFKFTNAMNGGGYPIAIENIKITPTN